MLLLCVGAIMPCSVTARGISETPDQVVKDVHNPITDRTSVPILNSTAFGIGPFNRTSNATLMQPVLPLSLGRHYMVFRPIVPLIYRPTMTESSGGKYGLGDSTLQIYLVPRPSGPLTWGFGPTFLLPTASDEILGTEKWGVGPALAAVWATERWTAGGRINQYWDFAGDDSRDDVNILTIQPVATYILKRGWYLVSGPAITANFNAPGTDQWTVPVGGGFGKVFRVGPQHLNISLQAYWHAVHPEPAGEGSMVVQLQSLFPRIRWQ